MSNLAGPCCATCRQTVPVLVNLAQQGNGLTERPPVHPTCLAKTDSRLARLFEASIGRHIYCARAQMEYILESEPATSKRNDKITFLERNIEILRSALTSNHNSSAPNSSKQPPSQPTTSSPEDRQAAQRKALLRVLQDTEELFAQEALRHLPHRPVALPSSEAATSRADPDRNQQLRVPLRADPIPRAAPVTRQQFEAALQGSSEASPAYPLLGRLPDHLNRLILNRKAGTTQSSIPWELNPSFKQSTASQPQ